MANNPTLIHIVFYDAEIKVLVRLKTSNLFTDCKIILFLLLILDCSSHVCTFFWTTNKVIMGVMAIVREDDKFYRQQIVGFHFLLLEFVQSTTNKACRKLLCLWTNVLLYSQWALQTNAPLQRPRLASRQLRKACSTPRSVQTWHPQTSFPSPASLLIR